MIHSNSKSLAHWVPIVAVGAVLLSSDASAQSLTRPQAKALLERSHPDFNQQLARLSITPQDFEIGKREGLWDDNGNPTIEVREAGINRAARDHLEFQISHID
jgi:hypothetical protein